MFCKMSASTVNNARPFGDVNSDNEPESENDENFSLYNGQIHDTKSSSYIEQVYRCTQSTSMASYSKYNKNSAVPLWKRCRRTVQERYDCGGSLHFLIPKTGGATVQLSMSLMISLNKNDFLIAFPHKWSHPPCERKPIPKSI